MANIVKHTEGEQQQRMPQRRDPWRSIFDAMMPRGMFGPSFEPGFDVRETKDAFLIEADLPGVDQKDLEVTLTGNRLQIEGKREIEQEQEDEGRYYVCERFQGSFLRAFTLPEGIDAEHASSDFKNGVLKVRVPKRPEAQPRKINVGAGPKTQA